MAITDKYLNYPKGRNATWSDDGNRLRKPDGTEVALGSGVSLVAPAISQIDATTLGLPDGAVILASGRSASGDNGGGVFVYAASSTQAADGVLVFAPTAGPGRLLRVERDTVLQSGIVQARMAGIVGDGIADDTAAVQRLEAGPWQYVDMQGLTALTTLELLDLTKSYYGGQVLAASPRYSTIQPTVRTGPVWREELQHLSTKSPLLKWPGKQILWLGTSIPTIGNSTETAYPYKVAHALQADVEDWAWPGSHMTYRPDDPADEIGTIKALSMTEEDRLAGLALHGAGSVYDDDFDLVTKASKMTCGYRIGAQFAAQAWDVVILDHNHNDRYWPLGEIDAAGVAIQSLTLGVTTTVTAAAGTWAVGDAVVLRVTGIPMLDYTAARVQAVSGQTITINVDSSGYTGTFSAGVVKKVDRTTLGGAYEFVFSYTLNAALRYSRPTPLFVLSAAPSLWTDEEYSPAIRANAHALAAIAEHWGAAFFDVQAEYDVPGRQLLTYFPDGTHPRTEECRQALANLWTEWLSGGTLRQYTPLDFVARGGQAEYLDGRPITYSRWRQGATTTTWTVGTYTTLVDQPMTSLTGWTTGGDVAPQLVAAPWGSGQALSCAVSAGQSSWINKAGLAFSGATAVEFDLQVSAVAGLTEENSKSVGILRIAGPSGTGYQLAMQVVFKSDGASLGLKYYKAPVNLDYTDVLLTDDAALSAGAKHHIKLEWVKAQSADDHGLGAVLLYVDDVLCNPAATLENLAQPLADAIRVGVNSNGVDLALGVYIGNLTVKAAPVVLVGSTAATWSDDGLRLRKPDGTEVPLGAGVTVDAITAVDVTALALWDKAVVTALGQNTLGDGLGGQFRYSASSTATVDNVQTFAPATGSGRLIRMIDGQSLYGGITRFKALAGNGVNSAIEATGGGNVGTNATVKPLFSSLVGNWSGTLAAATNGYLNQIIINGDTLAANNASGAEAMALLVGHTFGGAAATGGRVATRSSLVMTAGTGNKAARGGVQTFYRGFAASFDARANDGGTQGDAYGNAFGGAVYAQLSGAATHWNSLVGLEVDCNALAGSSVTYKVGLQVVSEGKSAVDANDADAAIALICGTTGGTATDWTRGICIGFPTGEWPIDPAGHIIGTRAALPSLSTKPYLAARGVDFSAVTFSEWAWRTKGAGILPDGGIVFTPPSTMPTLANGEACWVAESDTAMRLYRRGSDGVLYKSTSTIAMTPA